jgi:hypothetical protein
MSGIDKEIERLVKQWIIKVWITVSLILCFLLLVSVAVEGQVLRPTGRMTPIGLGDCDCPEPGSFWCEMLPDACAQCWEECPPLPPPPPPPFDYNVPRGVGVTQLAYDMSRPESTRHFTTAALLDELRDQDIRIVKLWLDANPFDGAGPFHWYSYGHYMGNMNTGTNGGGIITWSTERVPRFEDMDVLWRSPDVDIIVVRFIGRGMWDDDDPGCAGWTGPFWVHEPTYDIASKLLRRYGNYNKAIIITDWEQDNQWACGGTVTEEMAVLRMSYVVRMAEQRQAAVQRARDENPGTSLKLMFAMIVNDFDELPTYYGMNLVKDAVPDMDPQPDLLGVTYWRKHLLSITEVLEYIQFHTGYAAHRVYIDEIGEAEKNGGEQYERFMDVIPEAFDAGYAFACIWMWRQTWHDFTQGGKPINMGMWKWANTEGKVEWLDEPNSGLAAIQELNEAWR